MSEAELNVNRGSILQDTRYRHNHTLLKQIQLNFALDNLEVIRLRLAITNRRS